MVRRVLLVIGLTTGLLVGGVAPAALASPPHVVPAAVSAQQPPPDGPGGEDPPPPPTCEPEIPPVPDPTINYCSPRERVIARIKDRIQRAVDRVQNPRARALVQQRIDRVLARLR